MLSVSKTLSFAFCKRSIILGCCLLFMTILGIFSFSEFLLFIIEKNLDVKKILPSNIKLTVFITHFIIQAVFYIPLFTFLSIRAKSDIYDFSNKFSSEFFMRIFTTFLLFYAIMMIAGYFLIPHIANYLNNNMMSVFFKYPNGPYFWPLFLRVFLPIIGIFLIWLYIVSTLYMAYVINFNLNRFVFKVIQCIKHPLIFLQIIGFSILFFLIVFLPAIALHFISKTLFSGQDLAMAFANCIMGQQSRLGLWLLIIFIGGPVAVICAKTKSGRLMAVLFGLLYLIILGLVWVLIKQMGLPTEFISIPISALLYLFFFFFIFCLMFILTSIVWPSGYIYLLVQGAFHVHKTFNPTIEKKELTEPELPPQKDDGWL